MIFKDDNKLHLSEEHLLRSVVDETELDGNLREHLSSCSHCREAKDRIEKDLWTMSQMAERFAPVARRRPFPFVAEERSWGSRLMRWKWVAAPLATAAVALLILLSSVISNRIQEQKVATVYQEMLEDEAFITEVSSLEDNALPQFYIDISNSTDRELERDDEISKLPSNNDTVS